LEGCLPETGLVRLAGANGSGKSTLIETLDSNLAPVSGMALVAGERVGSPGAKRMTAVCRTRVDAFPEMTIYDHLYFTSKFHAEPLDSLLELSSQFGLERWLDSPFHQLSTGVTRRAWLIVCLARSAPVALVDEPFLGLDSEATREVVRLLHSLSQDRLVVVVAHDWPRDLAYGSELVLGTSSPLVGGKPGD
jgi:ABC-type multidrug transport system ATPase subunit